tara:strand:+ start:217 stop:768 length:552 start_codon:yes stop_codon:yes gene_type:complete
MNRIFSLILIVLLSPLFLLISTYIIIADGFPFIFVQKKYGKNNKIFNLYKFRTMKKNTPNIATENFDDAVSYMIPGGLFLRKFSLDEIPQFFNILFGNMVFIGPRPSMTENEEIVYKLRNENGVNELTPGITGWAQVNGRDINSFEKKVELDYYYKKNKSFFLDLKIILLTFKVVFITRDIKH